VLAPHQLIPIISYMVQGGRCGHCRKTISWRYPSVELGVGLVFFALAGVASGWNLVLLCIIALLFVVVLLIDVQTLTVPIEHLVAIILISVGWSLLQGELLVDASFSSHYPAAVSSLVGAATGFLLIWGIAKSWKLLRGIEGMGEGDAWVAMAMGATMGYQLLLLAICFGVWLGAAGGLLAIAMRKSNVQSRIPFGPFLVFGWLLALVWGQDFLSWYIL
jgi:prepilin signal peptidase PulO-like enzyme (type II secretory pathway)